MGRERIRRGGDRVGEAGSYAYPPGRGVYPLGSYVYPAGRRVYPGLLPAGAEGGDGEALGAKCSCGQHYSSWRISGTMLLLPT